MKRIFFLLVLLLSLPSFSKEWIDKSETIFFPPEFGKTLATYKSFPVFWWNFVVLESDSDEKTLKAAHVACNTLKGSPHFTRVECLQDLLSLGALLRDWAEDSPLREDPPQDYRRKLDKTLSQLTMPLPEDAFTLVRQDPLALYESLQALVERNLRLTVPRQRGFFLDSITHRAVIPVQVRFSPSQSDELSPVIEEIEKGLTETKFYFFGPHGSTLTNKNRISKDLEWVSWVGILVLIASLTFLAWVSRLRMALVFLPIFLSTGLAYLTMLLVFGKIHGLTLAFGPGLIGLVIDYGIVAVFNPGKKSVWRSNLMGFLTTLVCFVIISFSSLPILRELMIFSIIGFIYGYLLLFGFRHWLERNGSIPPHSIKGFHHPIFVGVAAFSIVCCFLLPFADLKLEIKEFDYQHPRQNELMSWLFKDKYHHPPLFEVVNSPTWEDLHLKKRWANENQIEVVTVANYLPPKNEQLDHRKKWESFTWKTTKEEKQVFEPFWKAVSKEALQRKDALLPTSSRSYLRPLQGENGVLTLWLPKSIDEAKVIKDEVPTAQTLSQITDEFPRILVRELKWIFPLSLFSIWIFLFVYYRSFYTAALGLLPFFTSLGTVLVACKLQIFDLSFVSLVGLVMILGLSVDYAIFVLDKELNQEDVSAGTTSGLLYAAVTTVLGFLPLLFCSHKVLYHLGSSLCFGTIGTLIGAFWGIPWFVKRK